MTKKRGGALLAFALICSAVALTVASTSSARSSAVPSWCGSKKIKLGFTDGFGGNSWRLVTTAAARAEAKKCPSVTSLDYADGQGNTQKAISDIQGMVAKGVDALVVFPDAGKAILPALRSAYKAGVVTVPYRVTPGGKAGTDYDVFIDTPFQQAGENWGRWILKVLPKGGNVLMLSGPKGNSQGVEENKGLHKILDPSGKYKFIGESPFEVTNWDPALTQKVLSAAIAKYSKIDVIVSDFGPSLVGALPEFNKSGRKIPALATSDGNVLGCYWKKNVAKNPTFKLFTVSTQNDHARLAMQYAIALATGGKKPASTHYPSLVFEDSTTGKPNPVECQAKLPGDIYLSAEMSAAAQAKLGKKLDDIGAAAGGQGPPRAPPSDRDRSVPNEPTVTIDAAKADAATQPTLSLRAITKHYAAIAALTDVSFEVRRGEVHALLGENGAGKSTLMNIASGATAPDGGEIFIDGEPVDGLTPAVAQDLGIAIVHQHPALLPDMTVAENLQVAVGREHLRRRDPDLTKAMRTLLDEVHFLGHLEDRVSSLSVARRHLLEIAKAFAVSPRLLILDEPTAPLSQDSVELLFSAVRRLAAAGTAVVYITHRLGEVRQIAERVTVLRDGKLRGTSDVAAISDAELLAMIIGRTLEATFPPKHTPAPDDAPLLKVEGLSGHGFDNISFSARKGEIVGVAGVAGNGQPALLRALAGREAATGSLNIGGTEFSRKTLLASSAYMPADRLTEGLMVDLNVRENTALTALDRLTAGPFVSRRREVEVVERELSELAVRAPSLEAPVSSLSGGNQQKVVMARAMLSAPAILVADEPTQGVDVGARAEIYRILREVSAGGVPVVLTSSDALELEGLCDRVIVMSRGQAVATLEGDAVTEERIIHAAISATAHSAERTARAQSGWSRLARFIEGDYAPVVILAAVIGVLGVYVLNENSRYLSDFNITSVMFACAALGFISLGQTFALLLGGIDLSVGPLAGFLVVVASFFVLDGKSPGIWVLGFGLMILAAIAVGLVNGALIRFARFTPVAATLVTYIALGGLAFTLRDAPDGYIAASVTEFISTKVGPVPIAFVVFVAAALALELGLRKSAFGLRLRAVGSDEESARRVGVPVTRTALLGYLCGSLLTLCGAIVLLAQLGVGDPGQGTGYTLTSITAVVLGGTSLLGGRGTFIGTLMGAGLSVQVLNATVFLSLNQKWQYIFQGLLIVVAAVIYSQVRSRSGRHAPGGA